MHLYNVINMNISATKKTVDNISLYISSLRLRALIRLTTFGKMLSFPKLKRRTPSWSQIRSFIKERDSPIVGVNKTFRKTTGLVCNKTITNEQGMSKVLNFAEESSATSETYQSCHSFPI